MILQLNYQINLYLYQLDCRRLREDKHNLSQIGGCNCTDSIIYSIDTIFVIDIEECDVSLKLSIGYQSRINSRIIQIGQLMLIPRHNIEIRQMAQSHLSEHGVNHQWLLIYPHLFLGHVLHTWSSFNFVQPFLEYCCLLY